MVIQIELLAMNYELMNEEFIYLLFKFKFKKYESIALNA